MKNKATLHIDNVDFSNIPFGKIFTDHMVVATYADGKWSSGKIQPYGALTLSPSISALHYGQAVFEGMKVFYTPKGSAGLFRPNDHFKRLNRSLVRLQIPQIPKKLFFDSLETLIGKDKEWLTRAGTLYLRPFVFATDEYVGVKPSSSYTFIIFACPAGLYYTKPLNVKIETSYSRSAPGGVGFAKAAGNYAASMYPTVLAQKAGFDQLIWTDAITHTYIEESGTMNIACIMDGTLVTPALSETILAGITRDSILAIAKDIGLKTVERKIKVKELIDGIKKGKVTEVFGLGTAVTIAPFASITYDGKKYALRDLGEMSLSSKLHKKLDAIKRGKEKDTRKWVYEIK